MSLFSRVTFMHFLPCMMVFFIIINSWKCFAQVTFEPPAEPVEIQAMRALRPINVDGVLDEDDWNEAVPVTSFVQKDPVQGDAVSIS